MKAPFEGPPITVTMSMVEIGLVYGLMANPSELAQMRRQLAQEEADGHTLHAFAMKLCIEARLSAVEKMGAAIVAAGFPLPPVRGASGPAPSGEGGAH